MKIDNLKKLRASIAETDSEKLGAEKWFNEVCDTPRCIAAHAWILAGRKSPIVADGHKMRENLSEYLGISLDEADELSGGYDPAIPLIDPWDGPEFSETKIAMLTILDDWMYHGKPCEWNLIQSKEIWLAQRHKYPNFESLNFEPETS